MAVNITTVANVQLSMLQAPEIAREAVPIVGQAQLANSQAPAIIAQHDQEMAETVQHIDPTDWARTPDALAGAPAREQPGYRQHARRNRPLEEKAVALAATHPRGVGSLVDIQA
jgi:hypothetical protein